MIGRWKYDAFYDHSMKYVCEYVIGGVSMKKVLMMLILMLLPTCFAAVEDSGEWDSISRRDNSPAAIYINHDGPLLIADKETGEKLFEADSGTFASFEDDRIVIYSHNKKGFYHPPYKTTVCDLYMQPIFTVEAKLLKQGNYYLAEFNDGTYGMIALDGEVIIDGLTSIQRLDDNHAGYYRATYTHETEFEAWIDAIGNYLDKKLYKNDGRYRERNCLEWALYRFGIVTRPRKQDTLYAGIIDLEGNRFEYTGNLHSDALTGDVGIRDGGEGLYLVRICQGEQFGWIYIDDQGKQAVPGMYDVAHAFVDGSAVAGSYDKKYLIRKNGERINDIILGICWPSGYEGAYEQSIIPVCIDNGKYHKFINRNGEFINNTLYENVKWDRDGFFKGVGESGKMEVIS